jgi:penicillin-binding protein 1A
MVSLIGNWSPVISKLPRWIRLAAIAGVGSVIALVFGFACAFVYLAPSLPTAQTMHSVELQVPLRVYSRSGELISQIGEQRRIPVTYEEIPPLVRQAVLAAEDDRFFQHSGLDWMGVVRALVMNVAKADAGQGGSTITQQAARNMFLSLDKTARRKLSEVFVTYRMEHDFTKEQILATYLNVIFFGQRSYGIAAAAETFYGKHLNELTVAEAATLAGIIQSPSRDNPVSSPKGAANRRAYVLRRMAQLGYIDEAAHAAALKEPVASRGFAPLSDVEAPYVAELARQDLVMRFGERAVNAGYRVFTTIDGRLQQVADRALRIGVVEYDRRHGYRGAVAKIQLSAAADATECDRYLEKYDAISLLQPAVVLKVADTSALVHIRNFGSATIAWEGMTWARAAARNGGVGAAPRKAADILTRGDVVYVVADKRGSALLAQLPKAQSAFVALDPDDGAIVSLVGGFDYYTNKFNRATQAKRQPGSGFKPFIYSAALENGLTPATVLLDMPVVVERGEENWRPQNFEKGEFGGPTRMRDALARSLNMVTVRILQNIGLDAAIAHATKFGFDPQAMPRDLTLALGSMAASPLDMATGYAVFANGGFKVNPYLIDRIEDSSGKVVYQAEPLIACSECESEASVPVLQPVAPAEPVTAAATTAVTSPATSVVAGAAPAPGPHIHDVDAPEPLRRMAQLQGGRGFLPEKRLAPRVLSVQNAWLMTDIMKDVITRGTAVSARTLAREDMAGKTGTSDDLRDTWFNGFNHQLVATVWVGFDEEQSLGPSEEGARTALPIWIRYMREAIRGMPLNSLERPGGIVDLKISAKTGLVADPNDPDAIYEKFLADHLPQAGESGDGTAGPTPANDGKGTGSGKGNEPLF